MTVQSWDKIEVCKPDPVGGENTVRVSFNVNSGRHNGMVTVAEGSTERKLALAMLPIVNT